MRVDINKLLELVSTLSGQSPVLTGSYGGLYTEPRLKIASVQYDHVKQGWKIVNTSGAIKALILE